MGVGNLEDRSEMSTEMNMTLEEAASDAQSMQRGLRRRKSMVEAVKTHIRTLHLRLLGGPLVGRKSQGTPTCPIIDVVLFAGVPPQLQFRPLSWRADPCAISAFVAEVISCGRSGLQAGGGVSERLLSLLLTWPWIHC